MVIGFDGSRAFSNKRTGTENYSFQLLKALAKIDHKNTYIVYLRPSSVIASEAKQSNEEIAASFRYSGTPRNDEYAWPENFQFKVINWPRFWTQGGLSMQTFKDKLDVLFVSSHTLPLIRKPGLKTVVTVHDLGSEYLPQMHQLKQRLYLGLMQNYQLKTATKIIAVSKATKEDLINKIGIKSSSIDVIHEGFDNDLYKKLSNDTILNSLRQYNLKRQEYFLFVGTVQPRKNLERVMKAFSQFLSLRAQAKQSSSGKTQNQIAASSGYGGTPRNDNINLVIAGSRGWLSDEIYKLPKKLGIEDQVKFLGYVPDEDLPALYSGAIAFVYPSLFEGFGLPILEAQACGCPVITSNISSMPEVAGSTALKLRGVNEGAIYVDPYSVDDIVKGMVESQKSRLPARQAKVKSQKIKEGFENIKRFSWEKCARETLKVLEDAMI